MEIERKFVNAWVEVLRLGVLFFGAFVVLFGVGWVFFLWPMMVGAYVEDGVLTAHPDASSTWKAIEGVWLLFVATGAIAYVWSRAPISEAKDESESGEVEDADGKTVGACPHCNREIEELAEE